MNIDVRQRNQFTVRIASLNIQIGSTCYARDHGHSRHRTVQYVVVVHSVVRSLISYSINEVSKSLSASRAVY